MCGRTGVVVREQNPGWALKHQGRAPEILASISPSLPPWFPYPKSSRALWAKTTCRVRASHEAGQGHRCVAAYG